MLYLITTKIIPINIIEKVEFINFINIINAHIKVLPDAISRTGVNCFY